MLKHTALALCLALRALLACAEDGEDDARFALPSFAHGQAQCGGVQLEALRDRSDTILSIVRTASSPQRALLAVGPGHARDRLACSFEIRLSQPLASAQTMGIDFVGRETKDAATRVRFEIGIGKQKHAFDYAAGRVLDDAAGPALKRFHVLSLPAGTRSLRITLAGAARQLGPEARAEIGFDALNLCFTSPEEQAQFCGAPGFPNVQASR